MATKVNGFEAGTDGTTIPSGSSNADPDSFTITLGGTATQVYSSTTPAHGSLCGLATAVTTGDTVVNTFTGFTGSTLTCSIYLRVSAYPSVDVTAIKAAVLAMDDIEAKVVAARSLRAKGFTGPIISHALHEDHVARITEAGATHTYLTMYQAGMGLADRALSALDSGGASSA
jgi:hypothetical protein